MLILWSGKVFFFERKLEGKVEILRRLKEAATRLLTHLSVNLKDNKRPCKKMNTILTKNGDVMPNQL